MALPPNAPEELIFVFAILLVWKTEANDVGGWAADWLERIYHKKKNRKCFINKISYCAFRVTIR